ncbi:LLM class flavin-dependent oxidoreductase [Pedococcus sp. 5OH_020]|uniref:LLM class flavin-dependent oxidoreductase n=1 Tax=Pedococcus sp. 5OH_020 TaxID=2989814 RepID=UPI0022E9C09D|nr:LLM class flavin-dependent oxidoreductase [Pedococcus sp. 5OH_020]
MLELSEAADVAGLDLVTIQDHPYQARHLDAWTLLSVIAARTTSISVAPNVANLPLRPPVVLARSVATLDLLSGGRAELGLGTGAFWDAIVAAGGPRRTPGQSVGALEEAIAVIRAVWSGRGSVRVDGEHYRVTGLHPGPAPAHDVELWLGAYKPRMLRVTGRLADGWLPSQGYADPPALRKLNATIDQAAVAAGRAPAAVRRLYNINGTYGSGPGFLRGGPRDWAQQLAELTLDEGMSTYIVGVSTVAEVERFAGEVAPATRELVDAERERRASRPSTDDGAEPLRDAGGRSDPGRRQVAVETASGWEPRSSARPLVVRPTPDDGNRFTGTLSWDEDSRPTLSRDPQSRYTAEQQASAQHLVDIHDGLRGELARLRDIVEQVHDGAVEANRARNLINQLTMRQNHWTLGAYCAQYCRIVTGHHTLEDRSVFPHLRRKEPALTRVLDRLQHEHEIIHDVLEQVDRALVSMVSEGGDTTPLDRAVDLLTDTLLSHLAYEERELIEPLARHGLG